MRLSIEAKLCNLLDEPVDAVVCSANNWLKLGTGIAEQIRIAGGPEIQEQCDAIIRSNNGLPLPIGSAVLIGAGKLANIEGHRRCVIHAIAMGYKYKYGDELFERILATPTTVAAAVRSALGLAERSDISTVALPVMCARPGYSVLEPSEAPFAMLASMIHASQQAAAHSCGRISRVLICLREEKLLDYAVRLGAKLAPTEPGDSQLR